MSSSNSTVSPDLQRFMRCTSCRVLVSAHVDGNGKCLYGPATIAPLTRENFVVAVFELMLSEMRAAGAPIEVRMELYKMCPHPSDQVTKSGHKQQCEVCLEEWAEP